MKRKPRASPLTERKMQNAAETVFGECACMYVSANSRGHWHGTAFSNALKDNVGPVQIQVWADTRAKVRQRLYDCLLALQTLDVVNLHIRNANGDNEEYLFKLPKKQDV
jgi:hypothetical protein